jgi:chemotaxis regulatin CheY-phosphate phosphatase CheZ
MTTAPEWLVPLLGSLITGISGILFYFYKTRNSRIDREIDRLNAGANQNMEKLTNELQKIDRRVSALERNTISEEKAKELIDTAVTPMKETLDEIKTNSKETSSNLNILMVNFSHLMGKLDLDLVSNNKK